MTTIYVHARSSIMVPLDPLNNALRTLLLHLVLGAYEEGYRGTVVGPRTAAVRHMSRNHRRAAAGIAHVAAACRHMRALVHMSVGSANRDCSRA